MAPKKTRPHAETVPAATTGGAAPESTAIAIALPGAAEIDTGLLDDAIAEIGSITAASRLDHARAVGECIVRRFGGGDLDAFRWGAAKHTTWRALADRKDLPRGVGYSYLWSSVAVLHQIRELPPQIGTALDVSHHRRLLCVKDPETKLALATKAVEQSLSVPALEAEISKVLEDKPRGEKRGRKPWPTFVKALHALPRVFKGVKAIDVTNAAIEALGTDEVLDLLTTIDSHLEEIQALRNAIRARLDTANA
jgi:hypothetical protein